MNELIDNAKDIGRKEGLAAAPSSALDLTPCPSLSPDELGGLAGLPAGSLMGDIAFTAYREGFWEGVASYSWGGVGAYLPDVEPPEEWECRAATILARDADGRYALIDLDDNGIPVNLSYCPHTWDIGQLTCEVENARIGRFSGTPNLPEGVTLDWGEWTVLANTSNAIA